MQVKEISRPVWPIWPIWAPANGPSARPPTYAPGMDGGSTLPRARRSGGPATRAAAGPGAAP